MAFVVLSGASGSGKTAIATAIARRHSSQVDVFHFDSIGVPSLERMIADHGSGEAWQRAMTLEWTARLAPSIAAGRPVLLEGQMRLTPAAHIGSRTTRSCQRADDGLGALSA